MEIKKRDSFRSPGRDLSHSDDMLRLTVVLSYREYYLIQNLLAEYDVEVEERYEQKQTASFGGN
jgi:hypothetical protein